MSSLPERPDLGHLRKQAKELLREYRAGDPAALAQIRRYLPAAKDRSNVDLRAMALRLHDIQSCIARQYGFPSWRELKDYVEWKISDATNTRELADWLRLVYSGDVTGRNGVARPALALRVLAEHPHLGQADLYAACALGEERSLREVIAADPKWVNRPGGPFELPPLIAVTHSSLALAQPYRERLRRCVRVLLDAGANPNQTIGNRFPPHSLSEPGEGQLSALYGAAGVARDPEMVRLLLLAGADPNDGESLYHSVGSLECVRLLLAHGAQPDSNVLAFAISHANLPVVRLLLERGVDPNEAGAQRVSALLIAIRGRQPAGIVKALLDAGADPHVRTPEGQSAYTYALSAGLPEVAALLEQAGAREELSTEDAFVAACARCDESEARHLLARKPDLFETLGVRRLRYLPEAVWTGRDDVARLMVRLGWPIAARGGDEPFFGSALNWAVFRGNVTMVEFLLQHGASWTERHGYNDNVMGTLAWSSLNQPADFGDMVGCARALVAHGMPRARRLPGADPNTVPRSVWIDGRTMEFSEEVTAALLAADAET